MHNFIIRPEQAGDIAAIEAVTRTAFLEAPHSSHTEHWIVNALRRNGKLSVSLVAASDAIIIGHVALSPVVIADGTVDWYGLGPISVVPAWQGKGVGSQLMHAAVAALRAMDAGGCVLLGEPAFYGRFGFVADAGPCYPGIPAEYFQALCLRGPMPRGEVRYDAAFEATA